MNIPLDPIGAVMCNIDGCYQSFDTEKEMKRHKLDDPTHFYCRRCNVDCEDWADLVEHKVNGMAPWVECRPEHRPQGNPPHIVCEFCGEDFKSMGGRLLHREQRHQAAQSIRCPGCSQIFARAGDMIGHMERNECEGIPSYEFYAQLQHKYVKREIMKNLEAFTEALQVNTNLNAPPTHPGLIDSKTGSILADAETDGGVLLDQDGEEQQGGREPPEAKLISIKLGGQMVPLTRSNQETWPRLLGKPINLPPPSMISTNVPTSELVSQITNRRGCAKPPTVSFPTLQRDPQTLKSNNSACKTTNDDAESVYTAEAVPHREGAWTTTNTCRALIGDKPIVHQPAEIKSISKRREEEASKAPNLLLNSRWWDPKSGDYSSDLFLHSGFHKYCCPFPECDADPFDHPHDIEGHLLEAHAKTQFRCPSCLKLFKRAQGMVSHVESTGKCPIRKSKKFKSVLDDITGGYIKAKRLPQPPIYRSCTDVVKSSQVVNGVMSTMYKAGWPNKK